MKNLLLLFLIFSVACNNLESQSNSKDKQDKTNQTVQEDTRPLSNVTVDNPSDYSEAFVKILKDQKQFEFVHLAADSIIIADHKAIPFPNVPTLGKEFIFRGSNKYYTVGLTLKRINYSTINYEIEVEEDSKKYCNLKGKADLSPYFFLGLESDTNDETGEEYFSLEYADVKADCFANIRIGIGYEGSDEGFYLAKIIASCLGECSMITLKKTPILKLVK